MTSATRIEKLRTMSFASIYDLLVAKVVKKGRSVDEIDRIVVWLTGYAKDRLYELIASGVTLAEFWDNASIHPNALHIKGSICGVKIEDIEDPFLKKVRYLDKLVDDLARGKSVLL